MEQLPHGGPHALWHPGLWHILVSEVKGGVGGGGAEAVGAGVWDLGGADEAVDAAAEAEVVVVLLHGRVWDEVEVVEDGTGVVHEPGVEREAGVWHGVGEGIEGGAESEGGEVDRCGGA